MTFVPVPRTFLVHASHRTNVKCPANASCLTSTATVVLRSRANVASGASQRQHPLMAQLLWTASVLLGLVALDTRMRGRRPPREPAQPARSSS